MTHRFFSSSEKRDDRGRCATESQHTEPQHSSYKLYYPINREPDIAFKALVKIGPRGELNRDHSWPLIRFQVHSLTARYDNAPVKFREEDNKLVVMLQDFICEAKLAIGPLHKHDASWQFGFVTAAVGYNVTGKYARKSGDSSAVSARLVWELPGTYVSCSGPAHAPWYRSACRSAVLVGPRDAQNVEINARSTSECTLPPHSLSLDTSDGPMELFKEEVFLKCFTWLVMKNVTTGTLYAVKTFVWTREIEITVSAGAKDNGLRAAVAKDIAANIDTIKNWPIPEKALSAPYMRDELTLKWYPTYTGGKKPYLLATPDHCFPGFTKKAVAAF